MVRIGALELDGPLFLAPMAGISDLPWRIVGRRAGAALAYTEMVSARALRESNRKTLRLVESSVEDAPLAVQLFGKVPEEFARAARTAEGRGAALVDVNAGCPARKVVRSGHGAALLEDLPLLGRIVEATRRAVAVPVTVKLRAGPAEGRILAREAARVCREAGADAVTLHPRTTAQGFGGAADRSLIGETAADLGLPLIASGDVFEPADALEMLGRGAAAVMFARGALGAPWLVSRTKALLEGRPDPGPPDLETRFRTLLEHIDLVIEREGEERGVTIMRKHMAWYVKGLSGAAALRRRLFTLVRRAEVEEVLRAYGGGAAEFQSAGENSPNGR